MGCIFFICFFLKYQFLLSSFFWLPCDKRDSQVLVRPYICSNFCISVITFFNIFSISASFKYFRRDLVFNSSSSFLTLFRRCLIFPSLRFLRTIWYLSLICFSLVVPSSLTVDSLDLLVSLLGSLGSLVFFLWLFFSQLFL